MPAAPATLPPPAPSSARLTSRSTPATPAVAPPPPLVNGDRLTRSEFERRYESMPHIKKAELIEGIVYMGSPVRYTQHGHPHIVLAGWLAHYFSKTPALLIGDNTTTRLDEDNEPQPDLFLGLPPHLGGQARVDDDGYITGSPELVVEVAASSASIDLHAKLNAYRRNGVKEYLVWLSLESEARWYRLLEGQYELTQPREVGGRVVLCSDMFPGLWLDVEAMRAGDLAGMLAMVERGVRDEPGHATLVARLDEGADAENSQPGR